MGAAFPVRTPPADPYAYPLTGWRLGGPRHPGEPPGGRPAEGQKVTYCFRPEHLRLVSDGIPATIQLIEPTGSETQVVAQAGGRVISGAFRERIAAKVGETIHVLPDPSLAHLFDGGSGQRISA